MRPQLSPTETSFDTASVREEGIIAKLTTVLAISKTLIKLKEAVKKTIESVIMIISGRGGGRGSAGGDHTLLAFFFNAPNLVVCLY